MVMALKGLPSELESVRNQILSGTIVPNYDTLSEELLRLTTPHAFGPVSPPSIVFQHQVTLLLLHLLATIRIAFEEGHLTPNLVLSVTIVTGLDILSIVAGSCKANLHDR